MRKFLFLFLLVFSLPAQTQHGVLTTWTAPTIPAGNPAIAGYNVYRCLGSATTCLAGPPPSGPWILISGSTPITATSYLDSSTASNAPNLNNTYTYAVQTVDANKNTSVYAIVGTVTIGSAWPANPPAPVAPFSVNVQ